MTFLNHTYFWAFLGILVPIAIHLWSRKKVKTIKVGSTKLLVASEPKRTSTVRPNEWWLLLLRILAIALLVIILAIPNSISDEKKTTPTYIIESPLIENSTIKGLLDSLPSDVKRILDYGFPSVEDYEPVKSKIEVPSYWQLAQEMEILNSDSIVVITKSFLLGFKGMRPQVNSNIKWITLDTDEKSEEIFEAERFGDSIQLVSVLSDRKSLAFKKAMIGLESEEIQISAKEDSVRLNDKWHQLRLAKILKVMLVAEDSLTNELRYLKSAYRAVSSYLKRPIEIEVSKNLISKDLDSYSTLVWLNGFPTIDYPINTIVFSPDSLNSELIVKGDSKNQYYLTKVLNSENVITEHLSGNLLALLGRNDDLNERIKAHDKRVLDVKELQTLTSKDNTKRNFSNLSDISHWIWVLFVVVMVAERIIAKYRKQ